MQSSTVRDDMVLHCGQVLYLVLLQLQLLPHMPDDFSASLQVYILAREGIEKSMPFILETVSRNWIRHFQLYSISQN